MTIHKNLTGADLHEPKGADTALLGQIYVSNGVGSGVWTTASSVVANSAWSTGDLKPTHKLVADSTWILWSDGTIGDGSSGATIRANADTADLFALYWSYGDQTNIPVSGGRGASAVADFAAHKTISLPLVAGRVLGLAGAGSGLTTRVSGQTAGAETAVLTLAELPTGITSSQTGLGVTVASPAGIPQNSAFTHIDANSSGSLNVPGTTGLITFGSFNSTGTINVAVTSNNTGAAAHSRMQPTSWINVMVKL